MSSRISPIAQGIYDKIASAETQGISISCVYISSITQVLLTEEITNAEMSGNDVVLRYAEKVFEKECIIDDSIPPMIVIVSEKRLTT